MIENLQLENAKLRSIIIDKEENFSKKVADLLNNIFSKTQIEVLLNKKKRVAKWSSDDIASAITLRSISPKAYRYLRDKLNYPLPGIAKIELIILDNYTIMKLIMFEYIKTMGFKF